jgi:hypothetical protein
MIPPKGEIGVSWSSEFGRVFARLKISEFVRSIPNEPDYCLVRPLAVNSCWLPDRDMAATADINALPAEARTTLHDLLDSELVIHRAAIDNAMLGYLDAPSLSVPHTQYAFLELLRRAVRDYREGRFQENVTTYPDMSDIGLSDDGSFEALCNRNNYVQFIHELIDCWVDSSSHPEAYPNVPADEWVDIASSLLDDVENSRVPSHPLWNFIWTLRCDRCHGVTQLCDDRFHCDACDHISVFRMANNHDEGAATET